MFNHIEISSNQPCNNLHKVVYVFFIYFIFHIMMYRNIMFDKK